MTLQERLTSAVFPYPPQYCHTLSLWIGYKFLQTAHLHRSRFYCLTLCPSSVVLICVWQSGERYQPFFLPPAVPWAACHIFLEGLSALSNSFSDVGGCWKKGKVVGIASTNLLPFHRSLGSHTVYETSQNRTRL